MLNKSKTFGSQMKFFKMIGLTASSTVIVWLLLVNLSFTNSQEPELLWLTSMVNRNFTPRECSMCKFSVGLVSYALKTRRAAEQVSEIANNFCSLAHIESPTVCSNIPKVFKHEILKVLSYGIVTPNQICGFLSNNTCGVFRNPLGDWEVNLNISSSWSRDELARIKAAQKRPKKRAQPYRVIHISDSHIDMQYREGSVADCQEPICCQDISTPSNTSSAKAGHWGTYRCDLPMRTFESALKKIKSIIDESKDIPYILWTGDLQPHDVWNQNKTAAINTYRATFHKIFDYLPKMKIFPTHGNHEMVPVDSFSPSNLLEIAREDSPEWVYKDLNSYWSKWLPDNTEGTILKDGFYSVEVRKGLRLISLNTNFCHNKNFWLYINSTDPGNQLHWLVHELQVSELANENVHIIGHIPPGCRDCFGVWSKNFNKILRRFSKTVTAQFYGHTHMDEFELFYDKVGTENELDTWTPISVGLICPAISPVSGNNPSFRIYTIEPDKNFTVTDFETYYMNITSANSVGPNSEPHWESSTPFTKQFGVEDTSPVKMHELVLELAAELRDTSKSHFPGRREEVASNSTNHIGDEISKLYRLYRLFNTFSDSFNVSTFDGLKDDSKRGFLCSFVTGQAHDNSACDHFIKVRA